MGRFKKIKLHNIFIGLSVIGLVGSTIGFSVLGVQSASFDSYSNSTNNQNTTANSSKQKNVEEEVSSEKFVPSRIKLTKPKQLNLSSSFLPTFSNGSSNKFSITLNKSTSKPAISFDNSFFTNTFNLDKPASNVPLNERIKSNSDSNFFIGYQKYSNGNLVNDGNYGSSISQTYDNPTGDQFISNVSITNLQNLYLNPNEIAIFSIDSSGLESISNNQLPLLRMYAPLAGDNVKNWSIDSSGKKIENTAFYYNFIVQNNGTNYDFFVPESSQNIQLYYNNQSGVMSAPLSDYTASEYIAYLKANQSELDKFRIDSTNSISSKNDFSMVLRPDDKNGVISIDVVVENFLTVNYTENGYVYTIEPTKTFTDVITFQGFKPDNFVDLDFRSVVDLQNVFDPTTVENSFSIPDIVNKGFGLSVNSAQLFGVNRNLERFIYNWPYNTGVNNELYQPTSPFDGKKSLKLFDFNNFGNGETATIKLIENYWSKLLINGEGNSNFYASISNYANSNSMDEVQYNFLEPDNSEQWLSLSTWQNYNHYILNESYRNSQPIDYGTANIAQPFIVDDKQIYYSTLENTYSGDSSVNNKNPIAVNLKVRNDYLVTNNKANTLTLANGNGINSSPINMDFLTGKYGSYYSINNNKAFEYLTGVISNVNGVGYWCAPKIDTFISVEHNGGLANSDVSEYTASEFLKNNLFGKKLKLTINGGIANTLSDMKIKAYADDINGVINVSIIPGIGVYSDFVTNNLDQQNNVINEYKFKQLEPIKFTINGFKRISSLSNTSILNDSINIRDIFSIPNDAYITFGVNDYLKSSQSVSQYIIDRKNLIVATIVQRCLENVYDLKTKKPIVAFDGEDISSSLLSQINSVSISIPENSPGGYNHLNVKFSLKGVVKNNVLSNDYVNYEFKLYFKAPEKISTTINPRINLVYNVDSYPTIDCNQIKYLIENYKNEFLSFLTFGYKNIDDFLNEVNNEENVFVDINGYSFFKLPIKRLNGQQIDYLLANVPVKRNEFIFGYPTDYYKAYSGINKDGLIATDDELSPTNWSFSDVSINDKSVSFSIGLKYFVNSNGYIQYNDSGNKYNSEFLGVSIDDTTTYLSQNIFQSPNSSYLASTVWEKYQLANSFNNDSTLTSIANLILKSIYELPQDAMNINNLAIIKKSVVINNIEGVIQFDIGLKKAKIHGAIYNWDGVNEDTLFNVGKISIGGFKRVFPTILSENFEAISFIQINGKKYSPSSMYASEVAGNIDTLNEIIKNDGLINAPENAIVTFKNIQNNIVVNNIEGTITINNPDIDADFAQINVQNYYDSNGLIMTGNFNFFLGKKSLIIYGFKKAKPTSLEKNTYDINYTESILSYNVDKAINLINSLLINLPPNFNKNEDIYIDNFVKDYDSNSIHFHVYLRNGISSNGEIIRIDKNITNVSKMIDLGDFSIINFSSHYQDTIAVESGVTIVDFNKFIASNYVNFNVEIDHLFNFNSTSNIKSSIINRIINSIGSSYPLINNAPALLPSDINVMVERVDNTTGTMTLFVFVSKYYENGKLIENQQNFKNIGRINISGFKVLPSEETAISTQDYVVSGQENTDTIDEGKIKKIIFNNATSIFKNLPINSPSFVGNPDNAQDNPDFGQSNITINNGFNLSNGQVTINDVKLNSYYEATRDERMGKIVWVNNSSKSFGRLNLQGFKNWANTSISSRISISDNNQLSDKTPGEVITNSTYLQNLKLFVWDKAIVNKSTTSQFKNLIFNSIAVDNLKGEVTFDVSLNNYIDNGKEPAEGEVLSKTLDGTVTVIGFKTSAPTTTDLNVIVSNPYDSMYPYELSDEQIKTLILQYTTNVPSSMTENDISYSRAIVNNFDGTITIIGLRYLRNYYDNNGNISNSPSSPSPNIVFRNFLSTKESTSIKDQYVISSDQLPFEYIENSNFDFTIKDLVINNLINGAPNNLVQSDVVIKNVVDNNINGTITLTVGLKKYINESGVLVVINNNQSSQILQKDVTITGFNTINPTSFVEKLFIDNKSTISPSSFLSSQNYENEIKTLVINKGIKGKWQSLSETSINIVSTSANNSLGELSVNISLNEWIDNSGHYHNKKNDANSFVPLNATIIINGFKQVKTTYISGIPASCNFNKIPEMITSYEIRKFIFDYLVINKTDTMELNNIELVESSRVNNNKLGRITIKAHMTGNYYDDNGNFISVGTNSKDFNITLLTKNTASPTVLTPSFSISGIPEFSKYTSYEFLKLDGTNGPNGTPISVQEKIVELIKKNNLFKNLPSDYKLNFNWTSDVSLKTVIVDNGETLYGIPSNGGLLVKVQLNKFMDDDANYVSNSSKIFEILLTGFKTIENGTSVNDKVTISGYENELASNYVANTSSSSMIANFILSENSNVIMNWDIAKRIPENLQIVSLASDNISGTITATFKIRDFIDSNGLPYDNWSNEYVVEIDGFKKINPTILKDANYFLDGEIGVELANIINGDQNFNISSRLNYSELNIAQLSKNKNFKQIMSYILFTTIKQSGLESIILNPTKKIIDIFGKEFNYSNFVNAIRTENFSFDYINGSISFEVKLLSYFSSFDGSLIENSVPLIGNVILTGFKKVLTTSIFTYANSSELSDILASDWTSSQIDLRRFISKNINIFVKNPTYNTTINDINIVEDTIVANNKQGYLSFDMELTNYFGSDGLYHVNDFPPLEQNVILSGFKIVSGGTTMRNIIDVRKEQIFNVNTIEELTPSLINEALYNFRNGNSLIKPIFNNLPDDFQKENIIVSEKNKWTTNYLDGSVIIPIKLSYYYNSNGIPEYGGLLFSLIINGFNTVNGPTTNPNDLDISLFSSISSYTARNIQASDIQYLANSDTNFLKSLFNENIANQTTANLPSNFQPIIDMRDFVLEEYNNQDPNTRYLTFKYNNYFSETTGGNIELVDAGKDYNKWKSARIKLVGFKKVEPTKYINDIWDVSNTDASKMYTGNITINQLSKYANEVITKNVDNILYYDDGVSPKTTIVVNEILERRGSTGEIVATVSMKNFINENYVEQDDEGNKTKITFRGFRAKDTTLASQSTTIDASDIKYIPSVYLKTSSNLIEELNKERVSGKSYLDIILGSSALTGAVKTEVVDIIGIDGNNSIFDKYNPGKIRINDQLGTLEFKIKVINTFTETGSIMTDPVILKNKNGDDAIIKLKINTGKETKFISDLEIDSSLFGLSNTSANLFTFDTNEVINYLVNNINKYISLGDDGLVKQDISSQKINIDLNSKLVNEKKGIVSYDISFSEWWSFIVNSNSEKSESNFNNCTNDSIILYKSDKKSSSIDFTGFSEINKEKDNFLTYITIGGAALLGLLLIITLVCLLFKNRLWSFK